ncbi:MAG: Gfo/Idh/MocA family oxidoreductase [Pirellulales bacterium]|nr:Gfo/Idh/MocA family oxidoreductase [Pirellulales bacterium]
MTRYQQTRRSFLGNMAGAIAGLSWAGPAISQARSPSEQLHVAAIGVGGQGRSDLENVARAPNVRVVALCDVDASDRGLGWAAKAFPNARTFRDYRRLFDTMAKDIDAVLCATPDHMHGSIAIAALNLGKHVYCEKPLAHNIYECRAMQEASANNPQCVTQMGTQIHSHAAYRTAVAAIRGQAIGKVREAHLWVGRSWAGQTRPDRSDSIPEWLDWDLWLGVAAWRPFVQGLYHPGAWRRWIDFGTGTLGDMGCHIFDPVFSALGLKPPERVVSHGPEHGQETYSADQDLCYEFAGTETTDGPLSLRWTDGSGPSRPDAGLAQLPRGVKLPGEGLFLVGEKGVMVLPHYDAPQFYHDGEKMDITIEPIPPTNHYHEWADACRGIGSASTPFSYACPVTEAVLIGTVAGRFHNRQLTWDSQRLAFHDEDANQWIRRTYREGWEIP